MKRVVDLRLLLAAQVLLLIFFSWSCRSSKSPQTQPPRSIISPKVQSFVESPGQIRRAAMRYPERTLAPGARLPLSLTASDGTGLRLVALRGKAVVDGPLAYTELHLAFRNPQDRVLEGRFTITLPGSAAVSRFAMKLNRGWQEGEVVEREAARRVYEDHLHRKADPALLERKAGNQFRARVFPIAARSKKEIKIAYSEALTGAGRPYRLHLAGLPAIDELEIDVLVKGTRGRDDRRVRLERSGYTPKDDLEVRLEVAVEGLRHQDLALARITPRFARPKDKPGSLLVLVDTSASRAVGFTRQVEQLGALLEHLKRSTGAEARLRIDCFDQVVGKVFEGPIGQLAQLDLDRILARRPLGASNLSGALDWAAGAQGYRRMLLVTDGIATSGDLQPGALTAAVRRLRPRFERMDVLLVGGIRDEAGMRQLVTGILERDGVVIDGEAAPEEAARRLASSTLSGVKISVPGARWVWPTELDGLQQGDSVLVFAELPPGARASTSIFTVALSAPRFRQRVRVTPRQAAGPLLRRAWAGARIANLQRQLRDDTTSAAQSRSLRQRIVALSTKHRVLADQTAMLVLETEEDYKRYGIDRSALSEILVVGRAGVEVRRRAGKEVVLAGASKQTASAVHPVSRQRPRDPGDLLAVRTPQEEQPTGRRSARRSRGRPMPTPPRASISTDQAAPGDPEVIISAPRDATKVTLIFPTGEIKPCVKDQRTGRWHASFLIAPDTRDGIYTIRVLITLADRRQLERRVRYQVDGTEPKVQVTLSRDRVRPGARLVVRLVALSLAPPPPGVRDDIGDPTFAARVVQDISTARAVLGQGRPVELVRRPDGSFAASIKAPSAPGRYPVRVVVRDHARNTARRLLWLIVDPQAKSASDRLPAEFGSGRPLLASRVRLRRQTQQPMNRTRQADVPEERSALVGKLGRVMELLDGGEGAAALVEALRWRSEEPGNVLALIALGEVLQHHGAEVLAARVYGSIIDLFPSRAEMRRFAGERLEALGSAGLPLAADTFQRAVKQRPDHPSGHHELAMARLRLGDLDGALSALEAGLKRRYAVDRPGTLDLLRQDLGLVATVLAARHPDRRAELSWRLADFGEHLKLPDRPGLRFVLTWQTDANDVDLHLLDGKGDHAYYQSKALPSGGSLLADVTNGYGPECFSIQGKPKAFPYRIRVHYYSRGPMGYGMGRVQVIDHDGKGAFRIHDRPFVIMQDNAFTDLGVVLKGQ